MRARPVTAWEIVVLSSFLTNALKYVASAVAEISLSFYNELAAPRVFKMKKLLTKVEEAHIFPCKPNPSPSTFQSVLASSQPVNVIGQLQNLFPSLVLPSNSWTCQATTFRNSDIFRSLQLRPQCHQHQAGPTTSGSFRQQPINSFSSCRPHPSVAGDSFHCSTGVAKGFNPARGSLQFGKIDQLLSTNRPTN